MKISKIWRVKIREQDGFTLLELLVVIAIIAMLTGAMVTGYLGVRTRTRDSQRKGDLIQMQNALEQYRADLGAYPLGTGTMTAVPTGCTGMITGSASPGCSPVYLRKIPTDPLGSTYYNSGAYYYSSDGKVYSLTACMENASDASTTSTSPGGSGCTSAKYYTLLNP